MSKVRLVLAELEGSDATVLDAIRLVVGPQIAGALMAVTAAAEIPVVAAIAPAAVEVAEEPAAAPGPKLAKPKLPKKAKKPGAEVGTPIRDRVVALLSNGRKTAADLVRALERECSGPTVYAALKVLREAGRVRSVDNPDGLGMINELVK